MTGRESVFSATKRRFRGSLIAADQNSAAALRGMSMDPAQLQADADKEESQQTEVT
jgi:hypothetical protein